MVVFHQPQELPHPGLCSESVADEMRNYSLHFNFFPKET